MPRVSKVSHGSGTALSDLRDPGRSGHPQGRIITPEIALRIASPRPVELAHLSVLVSSPNLPSGERENFLFRPVWGRSEHEQVRKLRQLDRFERFAG